ncbi:MAG: hypothetical protein BMS9Abin25_0087 [Gammaproteobacteria bacterium]|nr:MAG: hypothetical protein BMS9Abin25_0087 [Gammaproteobacteria bacterium]
MGIGFEISRHGSSGRLFIVELVIIWIMPSVHWMFTEDDESTDGKFIEYSKEPDKREKFDPSLYKEIADLLKNNNKRKVSRIENSTILNGCHYFSSLVPDQAESRKHWLSSLLTASQKCNLIFLDPDICLEIKSKHLWA